MKKQVKSIKEFTWAVIYMPLVFTIVTTFLLLMASPIFDIREVIVFVLAITAVLLVVSFMAHTIYYFMED